MLRRSEWSCLQGATFGEMVETLNFHHFANQEPLYDPSYANKGAVDNDM
jgi:hypothetical protein